MPQPRASRSQRTARAGPAALAGLLGLVALAGCSTLPDSGAPVRECVPAEVEGAQPMEPQLTLLSRRVRVAVGCHLAEGRRLTLAYRAPSGGDCFVLAGVEVAERSDAVLVAVELARVGGPTSGMCPPDPPLQLAVVTLSAALGERPLLDAAGG